MRETDYDARIAFVTSRTRLDSAEDAAFSARSGALRATAPCGATNLRGGVGAL